MRTTLRVPALLAVAVATTLALAAPANAAPAMTIEPAGPYQDGQTVTVKGTGFTAGKTLGVTLCSDQGESTGASDCDLGGIKTGTAGANGSVTVTGVVIKAGPFGGNNRTCSATAKCVLSLGELSADPAAERAVTSIVVGAGGGAIARTGATTLPLVALALSLMLLGVGMYRVGDSRLG